LFSQFKRVFKKLRNLREAGTLIGTAFFDQRISIRARCEYYSELTEAFDGYAANFGCGARRQISHRAHAVNLGSSAADFSPRTDRSGARTSVDQYAACGDGDRPLSVSQAWRCSLHRYERTKDDVAAAAGDGNVFWRRCSSQTRMRLLLDCRV